MSVKFILKCAVPVLALMASLISGVTSVQAAEVKQAHHIVFQVLDDDPVKWVHVLGIAKNVQQYLGRDNVAIEIVVHSGGVYMVTRDSAVANSITAAQKNGIVFAVCEQTMKRDNFSQKDLHDGMKLVPIGAVEIMQKQEAGWSYLKL
jgi:intracellular sulfur oxidation DsrE/DsrF family protein